MSDSMKGYTPKGDSICCPNYKASAKPLGTEAVVKNVTPDPTLKSQPSVAQAVKGLASPLKH